MPVQRRLSNRSMASCNPITDAFKYVAVWLMFECPSISFTKWIGQEDASGSDIIREPLTVTA